MTVAIIEDEITARKKIERLFREHVPGGTILFESGSVKGSVRHLLEYGEPDLMLVDIQLSDGLSLEIFNQVKTQCPVIFTTAYDNFTLEAFALNGIDYLLKPIKSADFVKALSKYKSLRQHFTGDVLALIEHFQHQDQQPKRIMGKKGIEFCSIKIEEVAFFYTEYKVVFMVDNQGVKYIVDSSIQQLERELDPQVFCRLNRQYLVNINAIRSYKTHEKGKLLVQLKLNNYQDISVAQEKAAQIKSWLTGTTPK